MQTYSQTFAGATTWQLNIAGSYFVTLQCTNSINVRLYRGGKKLDLGDMAGLLAGLEIGPLPSLDGFPFAFDRVEIDVTGADTIKVGVGNGQARYNRANGTVDVNSFTAAAAAILQRPEAATGFFSDASAMAANTALQVFSPGSNVNGCILLTAYSTAVFGTGFGMALSAHTTAPIAITAGEQIALAMNNMTTSLGICNINMTISQYIPAGKGLYFISDSAIVAGTTGFPNYRSCRYKLL